jgi:hypothetical protein
MVGGGAFGETAGAGTTGGADDARRSATPRAATMPNADAVANPATRMRLAAAAWRRRGRRPARACAASRAWSGDGVMSVVVLLVRLVTLVLVV